MFWTCHFLIWLNFCYYTVYIFLIIFDCKPIKKGWSTRVYPPIEGSCLDLNAAYVTGAVINVFSDFSIVILPQFFVWRLQVSLKRKIGLCSIFVIGFLWVEDVYFIFNITAHDGNSGCASSIVRLYNAVKLTHDRDPLYLAGVQDLWAIVEATCGILAMCLPVSPKFFKSLSDTKLWSILKSSFPSFTRPKTELSRTSETCPDEIKALKLNNGFHSLQATFKKYNYVSVHSIPSVSSPSINPVSSSSIAGSDRAAVRNNSWNINILKPPPHHFLRAMFLLFLFLSCQRDRLSLSFLSFSGTISLQLGHRTAHSIPTWASIWIDGVPMAFWRGGSRESAERASSCVLGLFSEYGGLSGRRYQNQFLFLGGGSKGTTYSKLHITIPGYAVLLVVVGNF